MRLPLEASTKVGIARRAKALAFLALPILVFAAIVFLGSALQNRLSAPRQNQVSPSADGAMSVENQSPPQEMGVTTVTTYVVTGKY